MALRLAAAMELAFDDLAVPQLGLHGCRALHGGWCARLSGALRADVPFGHNAAHGILGHWCLALEFGP